LARGEPFERLEGRAKHVVPLIVSSRFTEREAKLIQCFGAEQRVFTHCTERERTLKRVEREVGATGEALSRTVKPERSGTTHIVFALTRDLERAMNRTFGAYEIVFDQRQLRAILLERAFGHEIATCACNSERTIEALASRGVLAFLRLQIAKVVQHPTDRLQIVAAFECAETHAIVRRRRRGIPANVGDDAEVLLDQPNETHVAATAGDVQRVGQQPGRACDITAALRERRQAIQRVRVPRVVPKSNAEIETALIQRFGVGDSTALAKHRSLPPQYIGDKRRLLVGAEECERFLVELERIIWRIAESSSSREFREASRFDGATASGLQACCH
jgi:hypothetical protein